MRHAIRIKTLRMLKKLTIGHGDTLGNDVAPVTRTFALNGWRTR